MKTPEQAQKEAMELGRRILVHGARSETVDELAALLLARDERDGLLKQHKQWCQGIFIGGNDWSGCACDCPACEQAYKDLAAAKAELEQAQKQLKSCSTRKARAIDGYIERNEIIDRIELENRRLRTELSQLRRNVGDLYNWIQGNTARRMFTEGQLKALDEIFDSLDKGIKENNKAP